MSYGFTARQAEALDYWLTTPPDLDEYVPCYKCKLNTCDDCEYSDDYCKLCASTNCICIKGD